MALRARHWFSVILNRFKLVEYPMLRALVVVYGNDRFPRNLKIRNEWHRGTTVQIFSGTFSTEFDIERKNIGRQRECCVGVGYIEDSANMPLYGSGAENGIGLGAGVAKFLEILDHIQTRLPVGDVDIKVVLLALFIDGNTFKNQVVVITGCYRAGFKYGVFNGIFLHAAWIIISACELIKLTQNYEHAFRWSRKIYRY